MNKLSHYSSFLVLLAFLTQTGCATYTTVRQHPEFASATTKIESIAILPPDVEFLDRTMEGNERNPEREKSVLNELLPAITDQLRTRGYVVNGDLPSKPGDTKNGFQIEQLKTSYQQASKELYEKATTIEESAKFNVGVGPLVNQISSETKTDTLLYCRYEGYESSTGMFTKDVFAGAMLAVLTGTAVVRDPTGSQLEVALIDGTTGTVLWANRYYLRALNTPTLVKSTLEKLQERKSMDKPLENLSVRETDQNQLIAR